MTKYRTVKLKKDGLYLNIGCGLHKIEGFRNMDVDLKLLPDVLGDVTRNPYKDSEVDLIICFHVLEHLNFLEVKEAFSELYRVIKPDCIVRISVPDTKLVLKLPMKERVVSIFGLTRWNGDTHQCAFIEDDIIKYGEEVGFSVRRVKKSERYDLRHKWETSMEFELIKEEDKND